MAAFRRRGWPALYGDAADPGFVAGLPLGEAGWIVAAMPHVPVILGHAATRDQLLRGLAEAGFSGRIALTASRPEEVEELAGLGAALVLSPFSDAADEAVERLLAAGGPGATIPP